MERILSNKEINEIKIHLPENHRVSNVTVREALINIVKTLLGKK
jgi:hypothetical protein